MNSTWYIRGGRIIDPMTGRDDVGDLYIEHGAIAPLPGNPPASFTGKTTKQTSAHSDNRRNKIPSSVPVIDAQDLVVVPGLLDMHVHLREPGNEEAETIETGSGAAAHGGFTTLLAMPNTTPPVDTPERIARSLDIAAKCGLVRVLPSGCMTRGREGKELADLAQMAEAGAVAFTDDGSTIADEKLMARAMEIAGALHIPILDHALDPVLAGQGVMRQGASSAKLGMAGIPSEAETRIVERDIRLCEQTGCAVHIQHVSAKESVNLIRQARNRGLPVTGEVTPHHLALTDSDVHANDANFKMNPPLGTDEDREVLRAAVVDGVLQTFATDHAPHTAPAKNKGFACSPFGVIGTETAVGITYTLMVQSGLMKIADWVRRWTVGPAMTLGLPAPQLSVGRPADICVLDLNTEWTVFADEFLSKSRNTPFEGWRLHARVVRTFMNGVQTWNLNKSSDFPDL